MTVVNDSHTHDTRYYTETESDSRFVNVTGDSMSGDLVITGDLYATNKYFWIDNPTKPGEKLRYSAIEGKESEVYFRGTSTEEEVILPEEWDWLVSPDSVTVVVTSIGEYQNLYVAHCDNKKIIIKNKAGLFSKGRLNYNYVVFARRIK